MRAFAAGVVLLTTSFVPAAAQTAGTQPKAYWQSIAKNKFELPEGATAAQLAPELVANLGSPDPELRDDLSTSILTSWIYQKKLLTPDDLRPLIATLRTNLRQGIGETGNDGVLRRSFSALALSIVAARDNEGPFLSASEHAALLDSAIEYFRDERDIRGYDEAKGWMHSAAHTSDLLKFLARSANFPAGAQPRVLEALAAKNRGAAAPFSQGEDERMARVVMSIVRRADFDRNAFRSWLTTMQSASKFPQPATVDALRAQQNARHLLTALWTELSVDDRPSEGADFARQALRETLKTLF
jgi:Protein of unknown function (DUF2785)